MESVLVKTCEGYKTHVCTQEDMNIHAHRVIWDGHFIMLKPCKLFTAKEAKKKVFWWCRLPIPATLEAQAEGQVQAPPGLQS